MALCTFPLPPRPGVTRRTCGMLAEEGEVHCAAHLTKQGAKRCECGQAWRKLAKQGHREPCKACGKGD